MKLSARKTLWIEREEVCNDLTISGVWGGGYGPKHLSKAEANELFDLIKDAIQAKYPNLAINPWSDGNPGTLN